MTDQTDRVLPASRQPVTPENHASGIVAPMPLPDVVVDESGGDERVGTAALAPTTTAASSTVASAPGRNASLSDATAVVTGERRLRGETEDEALSPVSLGKGRDEPGEGPAAGGLGAVGAGAAASRAPRHAAPAGTGTGGPSPAPGGSSFGASLLKPADTTPARVARPEPPTVAAKPGGTREPDEIERDIVARREHLAWAIDEISERVKPANVIEKAKDRGRAQVLEPSGQVRTERVGPAIGVVVGLVVLRIARWLRRRKKRK